MTNTKLQWQESFVRAERHDIEQRMKDEQTLLTDSEIAVRVHKERIEQLQAQLDLVNETLKKFTSCAQDKQKP